MILVDANVLLYAIDEDSILHKQTKSWLETVLSGRGTVAFSWVVILAFLRLTTKREIVPNPLSVETAFDLVQAWLDHPGVVILHPGERHAAILRSLLLESGAAGNLTTDAHLAALAIEHGADLYSFDRDFQRFSGLRSRIPQT